MEKQVINRTKSSSVNGDAGAVTIKSSSSFPLSLWEIAAACGVVLAFFCGLLCVYLTMPASDYSFLKLPKTLQDLQILRYILFFYFMGSCFFFTFLIYLHCVIFQKELIFYLQQDVQNFVFNQTIYMFMHSVEICLRLYS